MSGMTVPVFHPSGGSIANGEVGVLTATTVPLNHPVPSIRHTHERGDPTTYVLYMGREADRPQQVLSKALLPCPSHGSVNHRR